LISASREAAKEYSSRRKPWESNQPKPPAPKGRKSRAPQARARYVTIEFQGLMT